jgi:hypothetical protein
MSRDYKRDALVASLGCSLCQLTEGKHPPEDVGLHELMPGAPGTVIPLCETHLNGMHGVRINTGREFFRFHGVSQHDLFRWTQEQLA